MKPLQVPREENIMTFPFGASWEIVARSWGRYLQRYEKTQCQKSKRSDRELNIAAGHVEMVLMGSAPSHVGYCFVKSHAPFMFCAGGVGGVAHGLPVKSKNSVISGIDASRAVSVGRLQRASIKRR